MKTLLLLPLALLLASCGGISGTLNIPLPDQLGGGSVPIIITLEK